MATNRTCGNESASASLDQEKASPDPALAQLEWDEVLISRLVEALAGQYLTRDDEDSTGQPPA